MPDEAHPNHAVSIVGGAVCAWSTRRLAYEAPGWQHCFRNDIRVALKELAPGSGRLVAELYSADRDPFDVENVLLYNVGTAHFSTLVSKALSFRRFTDLPTPKDVEGRTVLARYQPVSEAPRWFDGPPMGTMSFRLPKLNTDLKPHTVWHAASVGLVRGEGVLNQTEVFGLDIRIAGPRTSVVRNLASAVKALLDGTVSALHSHAENQYTDTCIDWLSKVTPEDAPSLRALLCARTTWAPLGATRLLHPRAAGIQWYPADDRCAATCIELGVHDDDDWAIDVRIFDQRAFSQTAVRP